MAKGCVPVHSVHGNILRWVTVAQAEEMLGKSAKRISRLKAPLQVKLMAPERLDQFSPASISYSEVLANAGVPPDGQGSTLSKSRIQQASEKVEHWSPKCDPRFGGVSYRDRIVTA